MELESVKRHIGEMVERAEYASRPGGNRLLRQQRALFGGIYVEVNPGDSSAEVFAVYLKKRGEEE